MLKQKFKHYSYEVHMDEEANKALGYKNAILELIIEILKTLETI